MKTLLTGATGFLGSHVGAALAGAGHQLVCLKRKDSSLRRCAAFASRAIWLDTGSDWPEMAAAQRCGAIVHCAWAGVAAAGRDDEDIQAANVRFFAGLLEMARLSGARRLVALGSVAEYGPFNGPVNETHPCHPSSAYGRAKLSCLRMLEDFAAREHIGYAWLRLFSTYGPGEGETWLMPGLLRQFRAGQPPRLTACEQRYDYLHVRDAAAGVVAAVEKAGADGVFNLGSNRSVQLRQIVEMLRDFSGATIQPVFGALPYRPNQVMRMEGDSAKFYATFGFAPRITLEEGLRELAQHA